MKRFLLGTVVGLFLGWLTVPLLRAAYTVNQSDTTAIRQSAPKEETIEESHAYKWFLSQMLEHVTSMDQKLTDLNDTLKAIKLKLNA